ncbi:MBOAT family O-acyltransferase [Opitutus terrae]|uniref:Membrane bound O-acyl transferase MBOAT family protein n=1 Tax=Opitutus terrae (strain DSM 11246 / JCM 15787 / PB90-1) TaxID=452637 RepID=B1ZYZ6_OPITP|nr:MBOAT family O-acyltransferase [Opitutus terrae]ACB76319.1 membrane bound O-acyl transferase MBOAT family protein [Opitutus terrae PB90-1]
MLFNSLTFVVFFALVLSGYWTLRSWEARKNLLLVASYLFYGTWNPPFAVLLFATTALDFYLGARIARAVTPRTRRGWLVASLASNLSMLGFFKYGNFLLENVKWLAAQIGLNYQPPHLDLFLPIGISFYTFHSLSYTLDVYRGTTQPTRSLRDFVLAVSFFPQLVAGPIVRAADFLPQAVQPPKPEPGRFIWGLLLMTLGLFEKTVLADTMLSRAAEAVFGYGGPLAGLDAWTGVLAFSGQIFFDFAGYSTCAIGAALCLGFHLRDNFRFPYAAIGFSDFWRRWHISLSTFLRDYLYIPLGGNRAGVVRAAINLMIVMFIGGLWHGAAWTFVVWGVIHGLCLVLERVLRAVFKDATWTRNLGVQVLLGLATYAAVCFSWVFFRAGDFSTASRLVLAMTGALPQGDAILATREILQVAVVTAGLLGAHWLLRNTTLEAVVTRTPRWLLAGTWSVMVFGIILTQGNGNAFIYFQF